MCIICNILCFAVATPISNFDSETCNTPPKRLWKGRARKKCQDLRQCTCTLKVPCRCTKQCIIRILQLHRIRIWTESWNLKDYDTRRALMYQLIERKPVHGNNEHRILDYTKYWIIQKKTHFENFAKWSVLSAQSSMIIIGQVSYCVSLLAVIYMYVYFLNMYCMRFTS